VKRRILLAAVVPLALLSLLPAVEAGAELGPPAEAGGGEGGNGFHGFAQFETHAQGQVVTATAFLNAFREDNSIVGAMSEINGPPPSSRNISALLFRGKAVTFVYGVIGGQGGGRGTLPDPPPGEANAFYPSNPLETTWSGPITGLGLPQVVDSRFSAKATAKPSGRTEAAVTALSSPNFFKVGQATVVSHTEPADGGVVAEAVSVLHQVEVGPLTIQNVVSRAYAFVPTSGEPKGIATTVVEGAKVGETPVQITDKGVVVSDTTSPLGQESVNKAMADAGFPEVRLLPSVAKAGEDGSSVNTFAGTLSFVKHDEALGANNPQGVAGGGFSIGGAEAFVKTRRCEPSCGGDSSSVVGGETPTLSSDGSSSDSSSSSSNAPSQSFSESSDPGAYGADSAATFTTDTSGAGLSSSGSELAASGNLSSGGLDSGGGLSYGGGSSGSSSTTAVTPPDTTSGAATAGDGIELSAGSGVAAGAPLQQQSVAAYTGLDHKSAEWMRDLYLMAGLALGIIFVGQRLARAFS
jgi:hypothetical protein